jgi:SAM-dependent methyltransferase
MRRAVKAYATDLAYIHDAGFGDFARKAAPGLLALLRRQGILAGLVVDLGCGSGIWARALVDAGYSVLGVDISADMIRLARRRVPQVQFRVQSLLDADLPPCVAVTALGECFNYLFDRRNNLSRLRRLFHRIHQSLHPGGVLIFDIATPGRGSGPRQRFVEGSDWAVLREVEENRKTRRLTRSITAFRKIGRTYRRSREVHRLQLYRSADVQAALRSAGFRVRRLPRHGKGWLVFLATRQ